MTDAQTKGRAGTLLLALALVGGIGCASTGIDWHSGRDAAANLRQMHDTRMRRVAELTPLAQAGDPVALTGLAYLALMGSDSEHDRRAEATALLERAAGAGYGQAQAVLGELYAKDATYFGGMSGVAWDARGRHAGQGVALLRKAAAQACRFSRKGDSQADSYGGNDGGYSGMHPIEPALLAGDALADQGRAAEAQLWHARAVLHCKQLTGYAWERLREPGNVRIPTREAALALILLTADGPRIASATNEAAPAEVAAAERIAAGLRRQVAASERDDPAPTHEILP